MQTSIFGKEHDFQRAFDNLPDEPWEYGAIQVSMKKDELRHLRSMCEEMAGEDETWERALYRCVRRTYVGEK